MPVDQVTLWLVAGGVILLAFVVVGLVAVRRNTALGRRQKLEIPNRPAGEGRHASRPRTRGTARHLVDGVADRRRCRERELPDLVEPRRRSSTGRRRRRAGSPGCGAGWPARTHALSRGLLMLLSRDRIDEETWEEFEETLITSDLGVAPTTELVDRAAQPAPGGGRVRPGAGQGHPAR